MPQQPFIPFGFAAICSVVAGLTAADASHAAELHVPKDHATIQAAINASVNGDQVIVAPGIYNENIDLLGKAITLRSTDPGNASVVHATIIRGDGSDSTIRCISGETAETVIDGLQIQNAPSSVQGGGMSILNNSIPTIRNCVFFGITTTSNGGGVRYASPAAFSNCLFTSCRATRGGAAFNTVAVPAQFEDCVFRNNTATAAGGAMQGGSPILLNCQFEGNVAEGISAIDAGGALHLPAPATITQCSFRWNRSYGSNAGAAVWFSNVNSTIANSLFCESWPVHINGSYNDQGGNVLSAAACPPNAVGACCLSGSCIPASQADCIAAGGTYQGDGTSCAAANCPAPACVSDIAPPGGDGAVSVNDLLKIINDWGACP